MRPKCQGTTKAGYAMIISADESVRAGADTAVHTGVREVASLSGDGPRAGHSLIRADQRPGVEGSAGLSTGPGQ